MPAAGWGSDPWGDSSWGAVEGGSVPELDAVEPPVVDVKGGSVVLLRGSGFRDPTTVEVLDGGLAVVGRGQYLKARLDLRGGKLFVGLPALSEGTYSLRLTTNFGSSLLPSCLLYRRFAEEMKVLRVRSRWASAWATGPRLLGSA